MSPVVQGSQDPDGRPFTWLHLEDFSPGIYDANNVSTSQTARTVPLGAADPTWTWACKAIPGGGLGPLPDLITVVDGPPSATRPAGVDPVFVGGIAIVEPISGVGDTFVVTLCGYDGTHQHLQAWSWQATTWDIFIGITAPAASPSVSGTPYPQLTRSAPTATKAAEVGTIFVVFPSRIIDITTTPTALGQLWLYPRPSTRSVKDAADLVTETRSTSGAGARSGDLVCFFNRIMCIVGPASTWPGGAVTAWDAFNYTTPPNSPTYKKVEAYLVAENPSGYSSWGSVSTGELFLVKARGGGVVVNGDIENPYSILYLPGVTPGGFTFGRACGTLIGVVYCSVGNGCWAWNGGNVSQKISAQLNDSFYDVTTGVMDSDKYAFFVEAWMNWVLVSGNWLYTTTSGSWWRIWPREDTPTVPEEIADAKRTFYHYWVRAHGATMVAAPLRIGADGGGNGLFYTFKRTRSASRWRWRSQPIHVSPTANHVVDVREIVVRASCPQEGSSITVSIVGNGGTWSKTTVPATDPIGKLPTILRFVPGNHTRGLADIVVQIDGAATTGRTPPTAPIVHSIDVAYQVREHAAQVA